jgi:hypothetical protein
LWVNVRASARLAEAPCATHEPVRLVELPDARRVDTRHHEVKVGREVGVVVGRDARVAEHAPGGVDDARIGRAPSRITGVFAEGVRDRVRHAADGVRVSRVELRVADALRGPGGGGVRRDCIGLPPPIVQRACTSARRKRKSPACTPSASSEKTAGSGTACGGGRGAAHAEVAAGNKAASSAGNYRKAISA